MPTTNGRNTHAARMSNDLRRALKRGIDFVAMNDNDGAADALDLGAVSRMVSVVTLAEAFGVTANSVARSVVQTRRYQRQDREEA